MADPIGERLLGMAERVLGLVGERAEAEVTVREGSHSLTRFANSFVHQNVTEDVRTLTLHVISGGRSAAVTTTRTDAATLERLVQDALAAAGLRPVDPRWAGLAPPHAAPEVEHWDDATAGATPAQRAELVGRFVAEGGDLLAAGYCSTAAWTVGYANSIGQRLTGRHTSATLDGIHRTPTSDANASQTAARLSEIDATELGARAATRARASADAVDLEPAAFEVILEPHCVANVLQFLTIYGFSAKTHEEGLSFARPGESQLDQAITISDDATDPRAVGVAFDPEGTPRRKVDLVTAGVVAGLCHDRRTAAAAGVESTGHASGSPAAGPFPANVFLAEGTRPVTDLIGSLERGLLVDDFWYTRVLDPKTLVVTGLTRNGVFLVEDGEIRHGVRNLRFTQSYPAALAAGRVREVASGAVLVDPRTHTPALHLAGWTFTGGSRG